MTIILRHRIADLHQRRIYKAEVRVARGRILSVTPLDEDASVDSGILLPGFIDAHVHVESSMLPPAEFARVAVRHGTVATVSDPHEIANVLGEEGIEFMWRDAAQACIPIHFGVPSCVPATSFETAGDRIDAAAVERLLEQDRHRYLSEMMNWPGVLHGDAEVSAKLAAARRLGKPVDGHAPGLRGEDATRYAAAGISTDHECSTLEEARDKAAAGMRILIREGSAARNLDALWPMLLERPEQVMFSTDDAHPDDLLRGHLDRIIARSVERGADVFDVLRAASIHPIEHYGLDVGLLRPEDPADFILVDDLSTFRVRRTWIKGELVAEDGVSLVPPSPRGSRPLPNRFRDATFSPDDFRIAAEGDERLRGPSDQTSRATEVRVIEAHDGELVTDESTVTLQPSACVLEPDPSQDVLLITVCNRYREAAPATAFIRGFGLQRGAIAGSVAHDSHQVIAVGADRNSLARAVNAVFESRGGLVAIDGDRIRHLPLPIAGLMSDRPAEEVAAGYEAVTDVARQLGSPLRAPFMTLSFMALLVIPSLKLGDRGLFDAREFRFVPVRRDDGPPARPGDT